MSLMLSNPGSENTEGGREIEKEEKMKRLKE
jgi:hypothetical protein